jgi:hypothetical protein
MRLRLQEGKVMHLQSGSDSFLLHGLHNAKFKKNIHFDGALGPTSKIMRLLEAPAPQHCRELWQSLQSQMVFEYDLTKKKQLFPVQREVSASSGSFCKLLISFH